MAKGYWIVRIDVTDEENYPDYLAAATPAVAAFEGKFLTRGGEFTAPEGVSRGRNVLVEFESYQKALDCYASDAYQVAVKLRKAMAESDFLIIQGA